jgi:hypothetical protein
VGASKEVWYVLQEDVSGSYFANDPDGLGPEVSFVGVGFSCASGAEGLARETSTEYIHENTPWSSIECPNIVPDGRVVEMSVHDARSEDADTVGIVLDVTDDAVSEESAGEESTSGPGE